MLQATGGVNTHKGALYALSLLLAAMGRHLSGAQESVFSLAAADAAALAPPVGTHGSQVRRRYGRPGAREEAMDGFPSLQALLQATGGQPAAIGLRREGKTLNVTAVPVQGEDGSWRLGAWTRDSMAGVGTLTFYDPDTGAYGALGHGITDTDTAQLMPLSSGSIMETSVKAVKKGEKGEPGQLKGDFTAQHDVGTVSANTTGGIFGTVAEGDFVSGTALPVAQRSQVTTGPATILSTVSGDDTRAYQVEIVRLCPMNRDGRDLLLKVTDPQLLETTGGIVQGMSGSPIIQNGRFVGAVTHVLVNDPSQGYGILLEHMLEAAG